MTVQDLTPSVQDTLNLPQNLSGVVITRVSSGSPAHEILQANDVIMEVDRVAVQNIQEYDDLVSKVGVKDPVLLFVYRDGEAAYVTIKP